MDEMTARVRLIQTVVWISAAIAKWVMALAFASLTLLCIFFWDRARLTVPVGLTAIQVGVRVLPVFRQAARS